MPNQKFIEDFFDQHLDSSRNTYLFSSLFLYKDKQLLKENRLKEYAERQIEKAQKIFWSVSFSVIVASFYIFWHLIEFGQSWHWFDLTFGAILWLVVILMLIRASKEYYTITASMSMLIKLLDEDSIKTD